MYKKLFFGGLIAFVAYKLLENPLKQYRLIKVSPNSHDGGDDLFVDICSADTGDELMEIISYVTKLEGDENDAVLEMALTFEDELDPDDWASIYEIAEEGSDLETVADVRAGDALEPS